MNDFYANLGRKLTDIEQQFRSDKRCICCGSKIEITPIYKKIDGKNTKIGERWNYECADCMRTRKRLSSPTDGLDYGAARASLQHEFMRRIKGNFKDGI